MIRFWRSVFGITIAFGLVAAIIRFSKGLGASTNLSDAFPWGLWIGFDILVGVGLAAGGFVIAATVNIFQIKNYSAISRPAILTAFLGYLLVIFALLFDLGHPYRIWHPLVMGNPHSAMFEVAMCVMLYTTVLALEFSPLVFSRLGLRTPAKIIHAFYVPLVIIGVLLSTLHQSSLGTLYIIIPDKLHGLWYTPMLPVFFFLSAIAGGLAMTIFESFMSFRAFRKRLEPDLLEGIARAIVVILGVLFVWKIENLIERGAFHLVFQVTQESVMFWGEMVLGVMLPMILFMIPRVRASQGGLFFGAMLTIMGFIINRLNIAITGLVGSSGVNYIPSWMEFAITASIVAIGFAVFGLVVKHFEVFPAEAARRAPIVRRRHIATTPAFEGRALIALWGFLLAGFLLLGFTTIRHNGANAKDHEANTADPASPDALAQADVTLIDDMELPVGEDSPGIVLFNHSSHVELEPPNCRICHTGMFRITGAAAESAPITMEHMEQGKYCGACHNGEAAFSYDEDCESCHATDD